MVGTVVGIVRLETSVVVTGTVVESTLVTVAVSVVR